MFYYGILDGTDDVWGVRIPDLPGCHGGGETPDAAMADAMSAAAEWLGNDEAPTARPMAEIFKLVGEGEALVVIPLERDSGRVVRANITVDSGLLADIDRAAKMRGLTRSAFLASAAREKISAMAGGRR
ncbi:hypothetical protein GALL_155490 [mine drainage metagenome]|uniref:HicB-like antitoxin of toxin-antitoxin system domain-containing protein n=1 Tax=mine drainage metagenome TaxID=410659 RepID=A0A1J5S2C4_9ZZZZ